MTRLEGYDMITSAYIDVISKTVSPKIAQRLEEISAGQRAEIMANEPMYKEGWKNGK